MLALKTVARGSYRTDPAEEAAFQEQARRYREMPVKPSLPEEARRFKVQAEHTVPISIPTSLCCGTSGTSIC